MAAQNRPQSCRVRASADSPAAADGTRARRNAGSCREDGEDESGREAASEILKRHSYSPMIAPSAIDCGLRLGGEAG